MKKKAVMALVITMVLGILAGCGEKDNSASPVTSLSQTPIVESSSEESSVEESEPESESEEPEVILENGMKANGEKHPIESRTVKDGKMQSWLTGEWKDEATAKRRNVAVMTPNNKRAGYKDSSPLLTQYGISKASIIYEAPVEGRITRLMPIYEDYDDLEVVGPIRSSRDYYIHEAMSFDSIYVNWGLAVPWVEKLINSQHVDNISEAVQYIADPYPQAFTRKSLIQGSGTEFTGYLDIAGYKKGVEAKGYEKEYRSTFVKAFEFADDGYLATYTDSPDATKIYPGGSNGEKNSGGYGSNKPCFEYNAEDRLYYRSQWGGPHVCGMTGEQLAVTNVILKVCEGSLKVPEDKNHDYLNFVTDGGGKAYIFTNGKVIEGTWERKGAADPSYGNYFNPNPTIYKDKDGNEVVLNQGKTWICCIWNDYEEFVSWE